MRFTFPLSAHNRGRMFKNHWKVQGNRRILELPVSQALIERNVKVWDATEVVKQTPDLPKLEVSKSHIDAKHPLPIKEEICYQYDTEQKILEGLQQAQLLTNTVVFDGLPKQIKNLVGVADQPDQDELVKKAIVYSHVWDAWQTKLPKAVILPIPKFTPPREYGIPQGRKIQLLVRNLVRLIECQSGMQAGVLQRSLLTEAQAAVTTRKNEDLIQFTTNANVLIASETPLPNFTSWEEVRKTDSTPLPNIFPIKYTIDLEETQTYDLRSFFPISATSSRRYLHTLFMSHIYPRRQWSYSQTMAKALTACHTFTQAAARMLYGEDVRELPEPLSVQCVLTSGQFFSVMAYQLNTLNVHDQESTRNIAWIEPEMQLFEECQEVKSSLNFVGYNPEVYKLLLAVYLNGMTYSPNFTLTSLLDQSVRDSSATQNLHVGK